MAASLSIPLIYSLASNAYSLPPNTGDDTARSAAILTKQAGYLYGPPVAGGPYFPTGDLGRVRVLADQALEQADLASQTLLASNDSAKAAEDEEVVKYNDLNTLGDYEQLYDGQWKATLPQGPAPGMMTNYTHDLLFSMERLSISPFQIRRLDPDAGDTLAFQLDEALAGQISGLNLQTLFKAGRLFYADYRDQKSLTRTSRFTAACDAYFYISPSSGDFLPLAIRTNVGENLIYTPRDSEADWLLAKVMFNVNDFWFSQWYHLAGIHEVLQISYLAAIRTLSDNHPVLAVLNRLMYQVFSIQPLAANLLFSSGAIIDQLFGFTGSAAEFYSTNFYENGGAGRFKSNYFETNLQSRGLIKATNGPALKHFPFYEDASRIRGAIHEFLTSFIYSYYDAESNVQKDTELQNWVKEAQGKAKALDFPTITNRTELADVLTHFAYLASTAHQTINTNELLSASITLPFHPPSLYRQIPTTKFSSANMTSSLSSGATNSLIPPYLPPLNKCISQLKFAALFARPLLAHTNRTILHLFNDADMLKRMNTATRDANARFMDAMQRFSKEVDARGFESDGLSQGMPFVWTALNPAVAPFGVTV